MLGPLRDRRGVTLVELMVVVAIIAILAAIAVSLYQDVTKKAKLSADQGTTAALVSAVAIYYGKNNGSFPGSLPAVAALVTPTPAWNCSVTVTYDNTNGKVVNGATIGNC